MSQGCSIICRSREQHSLACQSAEWSARSLLCGTLTSSPASSCAAPAAERSRKRKRRLRIGSKRSVPKEFKGQVQPTLARWFSPKFVQESPAAMAWVSDLILATSADGYAGCARAIQGLDVTDALSEVRAKTLIIAGELDLAFPEKVSRAIQQKIANSEFNFASRRCPPRQRREGSSIQRNPPGFSWPDSGLIFLYVLSPK